MVDETTNNPLTEDELEELRAQLEAEQKAIESLRAERSNLEAQLAEKDQSIAQLKMEVDRLTKDLEALKSERETLSKTVAELNSKLERAIAKYRDLIVSSNPTIADLIQGASIDEIDASAEKAKTILEKVKASLEAQTQAVTVPAGAPPRTSPPVEEMSSREKIAYGISQRRR